MSELHAMGTVPVLVDDGIDGSALLLCPLCGGEFTHLVQPCAIPGFDSYAAAPDHWVRGHVIEVRGWCEACSGRWTIQFGEHKGNVFVRSLERDEV